VEAAARLASRGVPLPLRRGEAASASPRQAIDPARVGAVGRRRVRARLGLALTSQLFCWPVRGAISHCHLPLSLHTPAHPLPQVGLESFVSLMEEAIAQAPRPRAYLARCASPKQLPAEPFAPAIDERSKILATKLRPKVSSLKKYARGGQPPCGCPSPLASLLRPPQPSRHSKHLPPPNPLDPPLQPPRTPPCTRCSTRRPPT
jgi:hypothetical protein